MSFQKGGGYHLDLLIVGVMVGVSSVLGLPWCVATTVLSLGHVDSLKIISESNTETVGVRYLVYQAVQLIWHKHKL